MRWAGVVVYLVSFFLLYASAGIKVALTLASVSLSVLYVWVAMLGMLHHRGMNHSNFARTLLVVNLAVIFVSVLIIGLTGAGLLLLILLALQGFVLLVRYGLSKGPVTQNSDSRLRYFGILLLGFFSMNPFIEGIRASNWIEAIAAVTLVAGGYLMFEEFNEFINENQKPGRT